MQKIIDETVKELIKIIDSKQYSETVALQFVLEELEAGQYGTPFVQQVISNCGIAKSKYNGAMDKSWNDVDGINGPQQYLLGLTMALAQQVDIELASNIRISIVEYIMSHYKLGKYSQKNQNREKKTIKKYVDLFKIRVDKNKLHPNFIYLLKDEKKPLRDILIKWAKDFEDRDNKFSKEFQTTFNSSFWELYLYQAFKELGMRVDFSKPAPDFTVNTPYGTINVEAVTSNHANKDEPEWSLKSFKDKIETKSDKDFLDYSSVRLLNAVNFKHKKYIKNYSKLEHVQSKPFIIAIAPFEQAGFYMQNNEAINRVLYAQGIDKNTWQEIVINTVEKKNGVELELGMFTTDKYKEISAIIFSTTATMSKIIVQTNLNYIVRVSKYHSKKGLLMDMIDNSKYTESHIDGLQIYHNPFAENQLDSRIFDKYEITHIFYDVESKKINNFQNDNTLISRNTLFYPKSKKN